MTYSRLFTLSLTAITLLLCGCSLQANEEEKAVPALIHQPTQAALNELQQVIAKLLGMKKITLASSAFTQESVLTLERAQHLDASGNMIMGRTTESPIQLELVLIKDSCVIRDQNGQVSEPLTLTQCHKQMP
ncbi:hypothetical protein LZP69_02765 [Shewanella sp. AS1]|uniref:hypothetical protein n=1 Tax=Shewanella sp. AS1 TaxID=2907626 RepID=UPI001F42038B|nr:hypothetical protein [Shewanella sp. AS1]MCE9678117.1 hypothetical protein [Shewanella sp. AS1]